MYIRQPWTVEQSQNRLGRTLLWLTMWIIWTLAVYAFYNLDYWFPLHSSTYDTGVNSGDVPSVGDYLFGTGGSGSSLSGETLSGENLSGIQLTYPTGYIDEYKKALLILQNDVNVNTYIDTDNLISSGFNFITPNPIQWEKWNNFQILWKVDISIEKLFIIWTHKDWAYYFESIPLQWNLFQHTIDANSWSLKPGDNTYYLIGKDTNNQYVMQYIKYKAKEWISFYQWMDKICILDVCSEAWLPLSLSSGSQTLIQQSPDGKTVVQIVPDVSITIAYKENSMPTPTIRKIRKVWSNYQKTLVSWGEPSITQKFLDKDGNSINASTAWLAIPSRLNFGNIKYGTPKINFENSNLSFNKVAKIDAGYIIEDIKKNLKLANEYAFALADWSYVIYSLDTSSLKIVNPTNSDGTYKVIPKVVDRMKNAIVYTVPSTEIGMHDTISSHFKWLVIEKTATCANNKPNPDPNAKFWLFPIDGQYDVVGLWNCYGVK